jgi:hypothetical protein
MMKKIFAVAAAFVAFTGMQAPPAKPLGPLSLWRLDCGNFVINDYNAFFSDTMAYKPGPKRSRPAAI